MNNKHILLFFLVYLSMPVLALDISQIPIGVSQGGTPLIMLNMERDHKLYYEAYNDASDIDGDSVLDIRYKPSINYYGNFDSNRCYSYSTTNKKFTPNSITPNKQCSNAWSGDFLNYLTTSRMDALRRVLYGGKRSSDTATQTVLERSDIPQDAHSWGKEYTSTTVDGYNISNYTPLTQPIAGTRHLFANTSLLCPSGNSDSGCTANAGLPLLRVLNNSNYRIWEWVSIERPVAGAKCLHGSSGPSCLETGSGFSPWGIVPAANFTNLKQFNYDTNGYGTSPANTEAFNSLESNYANGGKRYGLSGGLSATQINGSGNPNSTASGADQNYMTIFTGTLVIPAGQGGTYKFAVDGDDAVDVFIGGNLVVGWYGAHASCSTCLDSNSATVFLTAGNHTIKFRHHEFTGNDNYYLHWQKPIVTTNAITDYVVRVDACVPITVASQTFQEEGCRGYPKDSPTVQKPAGILQQFGENDRIAFGLMTGSYAKNTSGGVLRKNISSFKDEVNAATGQYTLTNGIVKSIDALKIVGFGSSYSYNQSCGIPEVGGPLAEGRCRMWGNPIAESMYEGLRYFAGKSAGTSAFTYSGTTDDATLGLPLPAWQNPYRTTTGGYPSCSKPTQLVISDLNPNFDTDQLPGRFEYSTYPPAAFSGDLAGLNVSTEADTIWKGEPGGSGNKTLFIGQSASNSTEYDGAPTAKIVSSFANIRGLAPEEPTQQGGFYAASVGLFGKTNDLNPATGLQKTDTFSVALASPLPRFTLLVDGKNVAIVPFAKTVGGCGGVSAAQDSYQPTNTIVDFYVDTVANIGAGTANSGVNGGKPYVKFRINFEDSEYGSDHDMDAIAEYELKVSADGKTLSIRVSSNYGAGGCVQHMGYVISGTTKDGVYLEVRDPPVTDPDFDYYLDTPTPPGPAPTPWKDSQKLPTDTTRTFTPTDTLSAAFVDHDPLWYAAKWGGFDDINADNKLDSNEWDTSGGADGIPDSYFLVTNAGRLKTQLEGAINEILARDNSGSAAAATSSTLDTTGRVYRARFDNSDWHGELLSFKFDGSALSKNPEWDASTIINKQTPTDRVILTKGSADGIPFRYASLTGNTTAPPAAGTQQFMVNQNGTGITDNCGSERVGYLRGDKTNEGGSGSFSCAASSTITKLRQRNKSVLGDIVSSTPMFVGAPEAGVSDTTDPGYSAFRSANLNRKRVIYVGANDGMLHAFDASINFDPPNEASGINTANSGKEVLAYVPSAVFPNLSKLTDQGYNGNHRFFVDDSPMSADVDIGSTGTDWRTVLVGSMGAGGKGFFALDITNPTNFSEANAANLLFWEFTEADMGFAFNRPPINSNTGQSKQIVKLKVNGVIKRAAIVGNGYNSTNGKAVLYVIFIKEGIDGTWGAGDYVKIVADASASVGYDNGLSTPMPVDSNSDGIVDTVYAGDMKGNMWKFLIGQVLVKDAVTGSLVSKNGITDDPSTWKVGFSSAGCGDNINALTKPISTCVPLFKARNNSNQIQPIFWPPEVVFHPIEGQIVLFGTGKYIETADLNNNEVQSFYGIWDRDDGTVVGSRAADLLKQNFSATTCTATQLSSPGPEDACTEKNDSGTFRLATARVINWRTNPASTPAPQSANCTPVATCNGTHLGWYIDTITSKERITGIPKPRNATVFFNTLIPPDSDCSKPTGFLVALDIKSGGMLNNRVFNTNGNNVISNTDDFRVAALQTEASIGGTTIVKLKTSGGGGGGGGGGGVLCPNGKPALGVNPLTGLPICEFPGTGRLSWREILPN